MKSYRTRLDIIWYNTMCCEIFNPNKAVFKQILRHLQLMTDLGITEGKAYYFLLNLKWSVWGLILSKAGSWGKYPVLELNPCTFWNGISAVMVYSSVEIHPITIGKSWVFLFLRKNSWYSQIILGTSYHCKWEALAAFSEMDKWKHSVWTFKYTIHIWSSKALKLKISPDKA